jgi:Dyp-type peroxidase family
MRAQVNEAGEPVAQMAEMTARIFEYCAKHDVEVLGGHRGSAGTYQDASILLATRDGKATRSGKEHFGFTDGISEVAFEEQGADARVAGGGKIGPDGQWLPHATGEFLLGHPDESQELPPAPYPSALTRNGTFLAYRKLHQNVRTFNAYIDKAAADYAAMSGTTADEARDFIKAKMIGRWPDGTPVEHAPTLAAKRQFDAQTEGILAGPEDAKSKEEKSWRRLVDFRYKDDPEGVRCPMGAHIRRVNTRDMLDPNHTSILNNRRRILRRGLPYGRVDPAAPDDGGEHGVIFLAYCASLFRQFEFIQQQWLQYGLDFNGGNDRCPILGNRVKDENHKFVIASDGADGSSPFICGDLPQFVETRGGEYFFMPSMTALRMMAMGTVDPT